MKKLKTWLGSEENLKKMPNDVLYLSLNDVDAQLVAIRGSNVFPITYQLLTGVSCKNQSNKGIKYIMLKKHIKCLWLKMFAAGWNHCHIFHHLCTTLTFSNPVF